MSKSSSLETFVLLETAAGYALCLIKEWSVIAQDVERVQIALSDPSNFLSTVSLKGWLPFQSAEEALENMLAICDGKATDALLAMLAQNLPKKKKKYQLGISDSDLAKEIAKKEPEMNVIHGKDVFEVVRCCRNHICRLVPQLSLPSLHQFQLGLAHSFSRAKIASDPARQDKHAQQAVALIDLVEKTTNKFAMRLREWYGWHFPELLKIVEDNKKFAQCALCIGNKDTFDIENRRSELLEILDHSEDLVDQIAAALKSSMGQEITDADMENIIHSARQVIGISEQRNQLGDYLGNKMQLVAPNLKALVGETLGGRLIAQAGSVTNLAKAPSSTIQILGAEKALFRALKARGPTPKYGLLFTSSFIGRANLKNKGNSIFRIDHIRFAGRISRFLANKIALAARLDNFSDTPESAAGIYGESFREQVEERLKYLMDGVKPRKNMEVIQIAAEKVREATRLSMKDQIKKSTSSKTTTTEKLRTKHKDKEHSKVKKESKEERRERKKEKKSKKHSSH